MEKWRVLLAGILILGIFGLLLISPYGNYIRGNFNLSGITGFFAGKPSGQGFVIYLNLAKESFHSHSFTLKNTTVVLSGVYNVLQVGDQSLGLKSGQNTTMIFNNYVGGFEITADGIIKLTGEATYYEFGDLVSSSQKPFKVYLELVPTTVSVSGVNEGKIVFDSADGYIERYVGDRYAQVGLKGNKVELDNFVGMLRSDGSNLVLDGVASQVKGDNFAFS